MKIQSSHKQYFLSDLFPYDVYKKIQGNLLHGLDEYKMLLISAKNAVEEFIKGNLSSFDSLVGENACQIRATALFVITKHFPIEGEVLLRKIIYVLKKIDSIKELPEKEKSLGEYLKKQDLEINIDLRELFLISSYVLTKVRVLLPPDPKRKIVRNEHTHTKRIKEISNVGSSFAREFVKKVRSLISIISVQFVQDIAQVLSVSESIQKMISDPYCLDYNKFGRLKCLPCFGYTFLLLEYALKIGMPLVLKISQIDENGSELNRSTLYFKTSQEGFQCVSFDEFLPEDPALIIHASCYREEFLDIKQWEKEILSYGPYDLILAYAAAHRQYPDESKDLLMREVDCDLYQKYYSKAMKWGCSLENPSLFFLVHAYCDTIKNIIPCSRFAQVLNRPYRLFNEHNDAKSDETCAHSIKDSVDDVLWVYR